MKVAELTGAQMDYWVARAEGKNGQIIPTNSPCNADYFELSSGTPYRPSTHWAHGGPLIEKYRFSLRDGGHEYEADFENSAGTIDTGYGDTPLQAICRAVVRAAFGDEVPDLAEGGA